MKGNLFLGYGRGSVGDVVFSRTGGQQVGRARNRKPNNPKTKAQVAHRALFADAVKFYTHGSQSLFKFAFESKQAQESDYNAFMRINAKNGIMLSPEAIADNNYPAIGNWIMSQGSLVSPDTILGIVGEDKVFYTDFGIEGPEQAASLTVAKFSEYLLKKNGYEVGDILTFVCITSSAIHEAQELEPIQPGDVPPTWTVAQLIIDPSDTRTVNSALGGLGWEVVRNVDRYFVEFDYVVTSDSIAAAVCIHSRKTESGLKVSTQELVNSDGVIAALRYGRSVPYESYIYSAWSAADDAILEGSVANSSK